VPKNSINISSGSNNPDNALTGVDLQACLNQTHHSGNA